mgnify:FL=1
MSLNDGRAGEATDTEGWELIQRTGFSLSAPETGWGAHGTYWEDFSASLPGST